MAAREDGGTSARSEVLGATLGEDGTRFVVTSTVAERVELCLFDLDGAETDRVDLHDEGGTWSADVGGVGGGEDFGRGRTANAPRRHTLIRRLDHACLILRLRGRRRA